MHTGHRIIQLLNLQPEEGPLVLQLSLPYFLIGISIVLFETAAFALFLTTYSADMLPLTYMINAVGVILVSLVFLRLSARLSVRTRLVGNLLFLLALVLCFYLGLITTSAAWLIFALPVGYEVLKNLSKIAYWGLAIRVFDLRQGKRLFGIIGAGRWLSIILVGFLVPFLVQVLGPIHLLLLAAVSLLGAALLLFQTTCQLGDRLSMPAPRVAVSRKPGRQGIWRSRYVLLIFGLVLLWFLASFFVDNIYYDQAVRQFPDEAQLAAFLGVFSGVRGILTLFTTTLFTGFIHRRFGIRISLLVLPVTLLLLGLLAGAANLLQVPLILFVVLVAMKMFDKALGDADEQSMLSILYQPLRAGQRDQAQMVAGGIVKPFATGLAGALLLGLHMFAQLDGPQLLPILLVIVSVWLLVSLQLGHGYVRTLKEALPRRWLGEFSPDQADANSLRVLKQALANPQPETVIYALRMLEQIDTREQVSVVADLTRHPSADVRRVALGQIEDLRVTEALPAVRACIDQEDDPGVRGRALCTYAALGGTEALPVVLKFVDAPEREVRRGAMVGLLRGFGLAGRLSADTRLKQLTTDPDPDERILAAQVVAAVGNTRYAGRLQPLLDDDTIAVQRAALTAAGKIGDERLWPLVMSKLSVPGVDAAAAAALVAGGPSVLPVLQSAWDMPQPSRRLLTWVAKVIGRIGGEQAVALLHDRIAYPIPVVRTQILRALHRSGYRAAPRDLPRVRQQIEAEVAGVAWTTAALIDMQDLSATTTAVCDILGETLTADIAAAQRRILYLLAFLYDPDTIRRIRRNLAHPAPEKHTYALELLDLTLDTSLKPLVFPVLERLSLPVRHQQLRERFPQESQLRTAPVRLQEIITGSPERFAPWLQAVAISMVGACGMTDLLREVQPALSGEAVVQETARWAVDRQSRLSDQISTGQPLVTVEKMELLKASALFEEVDGESLFELASVVPEMSVMAGTTLFEEGMPGDSLYLVTQGTLKIQRRDVVVHHADRGDVLGELAVLGNRPRLASVMAVTDAHLLRLDHALLFSFILNRGEVAQSVLRFASRTLRERYQAYRVLYDTRHSGSTVMAGQ